MLLACAFLALACTALYTALIIFYTLCLDDVRAYALFPPPSWTREHWHGAPSFSRPR